MVMDNLNIHCEKSLATVFGAEVRLADLAKVRHPLHAPAWRLAPSGSTAATPLQRKKTKTEKNYLQRWAKSEHRSGPRRSSEHMAVRPESSQECLRLPQKPFHTVSAMNKARYKQNNQQALFARLRRKKST